MARPPEKIPEFQKSLYRETLESGIFPPQIKWGRERGWLVVQDPVDGTWFSIPAKGAPSGWARIATETKYGGGR